MDIIEKARGFAVQAHGDQLYSGKPYETHLTAVVRVLEDFDQSEELRAAGWLHDVIEDTAVSRECLEREFGHAIAELVWCCTGEGRNRKERNRSIYRKIADCPRAAVVKVADRIANVEASAADSSHRAMYRAEQASFAEAIGPLVPTSLWARLEKAFGADT